MNEQTNTGRLVLAYLRLAALVFGGSVLIGAAVGIGWRLVSQ